MPMVEKCQYPMCMIVQIPISWYKQNDIIWKDCYGNKECARFAVPLDYLDENEDGPWAKIALIRIPAKVSREDPAYRGPVLINPGMYAS